MTNCEDDSPIKWDRGHYTLKIPSNPKGFEPYEHQSLAWNTMTGYFNATSRGGIIWIPTGGGKTVIAAKWLLEQVVDKGYKVIWFAHRGILLEQASGTFKSLICRTKLMETKQEVKLAYVISQPQGGIQWKNVKPDTDIVFASLASSTKHIPEIESFGKTSVKGVYIVFDEVQHAYATSYRKLLVSLKSKFPAWFIGLSATPYRMTKEESIGLWELFSAHDRSKADISPIIRVLQGVLIQRRILAKPKFHDKRTEIEPIVENGENILDDFKGLTSAAAKNLAENEERNKVICRLYIENFLNSKNEEDRFGKTIIFTPDTSGNKRLFATFQNILKDYNREGAIKFDYIDYTRSEKDKKDILARYRLKEKDKLTNKVPIDILINVEMCTEGFDAPLTKTVFLARPSNSETLVRQMIGRAMRGPIPGGNEICHIVRFVDNLPEDFNLIDPEKTYEEEGDTRIRFIPLPKDVLNQYKKQFDLFNSPIHCSLQFQYHYIPAGWFYFLKSNPNDESSPTPDINPEQTDIKEFYVMYLEAQIYGYDRLAKQLSTEDRERITPLTYNAIIAEFFFDCPDPLPNEPSLLNFVELFPNSGDNFETDIKIHFEVRETLSPDTNFEELIRTNVITADSDNDPNIQEYDSNTHLSTFWGNKEELIADIKKYMWYKNNPIISNHGQEDSSVIRNYIQDNYSIGSILDFQSTFSNLANLNGNSLISATSIRIHESNFFNVSHPIGFCRFTNLGPQIHISSVVRSRALPRVIIEYMLYHLYVHSITPYDHHGELFREEEKLFIPSELAGEEIYNHPIWNLLTYKPPTITWVEFCRYYLGLFIEDKIKSIQENGKKPGQSLNQSHDVDIDDYL